MDDKGKDEKMAKEKKSAEVVKRSVVNLSDEDYEKIVKLQNKFDKFNQPNSTIDRDSSIAHILSHMEQEKVLELKAKFENLNVKRFVHMEDKTASAVDYSKTLEDDQSSTPKKKQYIKMEELRKVRENIEKQILEREMEIMDKQRDTVKKVNLKHLYTDPEKAKIARNLINTTLRNDLDELLSGDNIRVSITHQYRIIPKHMSIFLIWRVEGHKLEPLSRDLYGTFYDKESYVIYAASQYGQPCGTNVVNREIRGKTEYHLHFWMGSSASPETAGHAAYCVVELDVLINGDATQHREIQGKESPRFKSYFREGISVLSGLAEPVYCKSIDDHTKPRLFRVMGHQVPVLNQMPTIAWTYFCSRCVFLLYTHHRIFVWIGRFAQPILKLHATDAAIQLGKSYEISHIVFVDDGYERTLQGIDKTQFETYLPLESRSVKAGDELEDDLALGAKLQVSLKLYQCCEYNGKYRVTEIKPGPLEQSDLLSNNVFIVDNSVNGIWVWVGKNADNKEKVEAIRNARGFVKKKKYPNWTPVTRVVDGSEPIEFQSLFINWQEKQSPKILYGRNKISVTKVTRYDAMTMHDRPHLSARSQLYDDGTGDLEIWRVQRLDVMEVPTERHGVFYTGDCYVLHYKYKTPAGSRYMIYYWLGFHSILDEQGMAELKAHEINSTIANDKGTIARITQGKEPPHFLQLFKGRLRVFSSRGIDFDISGKNQKTATHYLLQIQGSASYNTRATQVQLKASSLNSNYCFVLRKNSTYYIWCGSHSTGDNREMAKGFVGPDFVLLLEGTETSDFWSALCGKQEYKSPKYPEVSDSSIRPRLFHCNIYNNVVTTYEVLNFIQRDLYPEQVMLLDAHHTIFLWIGNECTNDEQRLCIEIANDYLRTDPCGRDTTIPIIITKQKYEPAIFTGFFEVWDPVLWILHTTYENLRSTLELHKGEETSSLKSRKSYEERIESEFDKYNKYAVAVLRGPIENLPSSVDPLKKELHLTYDDFVSIFRMDYKDFEQIPLWKQQEMKKHAGLF